MAREHDLLLGWVSTVGRASDDRVRRATDGASLGRFGRLGIRNCFDELQRAGHVEREPKAWRVVASTLVWRPGQAELYGARDLHLRDHFAREGLPVQVTASALGADLWRLACAREEAEAACQRAGVRFVNDRSTELLSALPPAGDALREVGPLSHSNPTRGRAWQRFKTTGRWGRERIAVEVQPGLWRSLQPSPAIYLWCDDSGVVRRLEQTEHRWLARWHSMRQRILLRRDAGALHVPLYPRLPVLVDRALRITSGGEVQKGGESYVYSGIDHSRALEVSRILGVKLQEESP